MLGTVFILDKRPHPSQVAWYLNTQSNQRMGERLYYPGEGQQLLNSRQFARITKEGRCFAGLEPRSSKPLHIDLTKDQLLSHLFFSPQPPLSQNLDFAYVLWEMATGKQLYGGPSSEWVNYSCLESECIFFASVSVLIHTRCARQPPECLNPRLQQSELSLLQEAGPLQTHWGFHLVQSRGSVAGSFPPPQEKVCKGLDC